MTTSAQHDAKAKPDSDSSVAIPQTPHMSEEEIALLDAYIHSGAHVLEFGAGGSTRHFFTRGARSVVSVESDKIWLTQLMQDPVVRFFQKKKLWSPLLANLGPIRGLGVPANTVPRVSWLGYHQDCWPLMPTKNFDLILIDGRFRVACLCQTLIHCTSKKFVMLIHDFWNRKEYHSVLRLVDVVDRAGTSAVLKKKSRTDWRRVCVLLQRHQFDLR